ncbi:MAG: hypothetical protein ACE5HS_05625 [bacterium]
MPYHEPDPDDPNTLVGVELPVNASTTVDMAYVFAEEFVRLGFKKQKIMKIFSHPFYAGSHRAFLELGVEKVDKIVDECLAIWGRAQAKSKNHVEKENNHA